MTKSAIEITAAVLVLVISGCTSSPSLPEPQNPSGTLLDPNAAVYFAKDYVYRLYQGSTIVIAFNVTLKLEGGTAAWNGTEAGNCSRWFMYLEGVVEDIGTYRYVKVAVEVAYKDGEVRSKHSNVRISVISVADLNATFNSIMGVSIERYFMNASSHELYLKAQAAMYEMPSAYYLQSISIALMHNTTSTLPGTAIWQVSWKYIEKGNGKAAFTRVSMDAITGAVQKVEGPR